LVAFKFISTTFAGIIFQLTNSSFIIYSSSLNNAIVIKQK